jgi:glycyl-tRNA synthetase beta chain
MRFRELLLEIGVEDLPAGWLPDLTRQLADRLAVRLAEHRLAADRPEAFATPRRLVARVARVADRQPDRDETILGPPVRAAFAPDGQPTPAALGFARKHGVSVAALVRVATPKGEYVACATHEPGRPARAVLPTVLASVMRDLVFPKPMRWDAQLDDGQGDLLFGRPIRWLLFLYGGRVVPFVIRRAPEARSPAVRDIRAASVTFGHRFLARDGRPGRPIRVRGYAEYRAALARQFVILDRAERARRIGRALDRAARRLGGSVLRSAAAALLEELPDLVEYPTVVAGRFDESFLRLPAEVLTTTLIHHQHHVPVAGPDGRVQPVFLAVLNTRPTRPQPVVANAERVVAARLRDAAFFWETDRRQPLEAHLERLGTLRFHAALGDYRQKAERVARLAEWIARDAFDRPHAAAAARRAGWLAKADLTTEMVREFTELQGAVGGIYAREDGEPEEVWKAIYHHYLPVGVEPDAPPSPADLGKAAVTWAAVSLADKLDTLVGLFAAGERPTGSRDPFGLRRQAQGIVRVLADLRTLTGVERRPRLADLTRAAASGYGQPDADGARAARSTFLLDRLAFLLETRGIAPEVVRAVLWEGGEAVSPAEALDRARAIAALRDTPAFVDLARLYKRATNLVLEHVGPGGVRAMTAEERARLVEPAERRLRHAIDEAAPVVAACTARGDHAEAIRALAALAPAVDAFFTEVLVMTDQADLRAARLALLGELRQLVLGVGDLSHCAPAGGAAPVGA